MLKSQLAVYLCSSLFLLPVTHANISSELPVLKDHETGKMMHALLRAPRVPINKQEMRFVKNYIKKSEDNLVVIKHRSAVPFNIIDSVFRVYGLPIELRYLAVIESELKPSAASRVGAVGPWQLMPSTAHILGLKVSRTCDERKNYYKSTRAAARYLKDLYAEFGDWLLVLAAYNGGPAPVYAAIHKSGSRNFWVLQRYLPAESREHVKKFIATHYFFEGRGSLTTLTKAESLQYKKTLLAFETIHPEKEMVTKTMPSSQQETSEEKFRKLMKESEAALNNSYHLLRGTK